MINGIATPAGEEFQEADEHSDLSPALKHVQARQNGPKKRRTNGSNALLMVDTD